MKNIMRDINDILSKLHKQMFVIFTVYNIWFYYTFTKNPTKDISSTCNYIIGSMTGTLFLSIIFTFSIYYIILSKNSAEKTKHIITSKLKVNIYSILEAIILNLLWIGYAEQHNIYTYTLSVFSHVASVTNIYNLVFIFSNLVFIYLLTIDDLEVSVTHNLNKRKEDIDLNVSKEDKSSKYDITHVRYFMTYIDNQLYKVDDEELNKDIERIKSSLLTSLNIYQTLHENKYHEINAHFKDKVGIVFIETIREIQSLLNEISVNTYGEILPNISIVANKLHIYMKEQLNLYNLIFKNTETVEKRECIKKCKLAKNLLDNMKE